MEPLCTKKPQIGRSMGKSSTMSSMNEVIIPEDLLQYVFARLPFAIILCFRTVCQWNNLLISFFQHCTKVPQANPWFYITFGNNNYKAIYDPLMKKIVLFYCKTANPGLPVSYVFYLTIMID